MLIQHTILLKIIVAVIRSVSGMSGRVKYESSQRHRINPIPEFEKTPPPQTLRYRCSKVPELPTEMITVMPLFIVFTTVKSSRFSYKKNGQLAIQNLFQCILLIWSHLVICYCSSIIGIYWKSQYI